MGEKPQAMRAFLERERDTSRFGANDLWDCTKCLQNRVALVTGVHSLSKVARIIWPRGVIKDACISGVLVGGSLTEL